MNQNYFKPNLSYNSIYSGFDRPFQYPIDQSPPQEMSIQDMEVQKQQYLEEMRSMINQIQIEDYCNERIDIHYRRTIGEKESDEFIKSSVEDLVSIPSEFEDTSDNDRENFKIYSNPIFEFDDKYISSDVNLFFNEVLEDIESKESYVSNFDKPSLLVTPLSDANEEECFDPGGDTDEIDMFLDIDVSTDFEDDYYDSEGDIIYLESLIFKETIPNLPPKVFLDIDPKSLIDELDFDNLKSMVKVFDPRIHENFFSLTHVKLPFEDC
ncbi:hypothetical protein Tco_1081350 [Tanacetum coccineum]|uniref:Reverse transcriptase domain-containing protein n=1 Tax=Tanacetum coccineum TaxID=301880 RepID=A0ABQ5HYU3_9ASTR